ncbi:MAG: Protein of unknown function UPF0060, partial [uncultured Solirubrobacteraceae bacterium]
GRQVRRSLHCRRHCRNRRRVPCVDRGQGRPRSTRRRARCARPRPVRGRRRVPARQRVRPGARCLRRRVHRRLDGLGYGVRRLQAGPLRPRRRRHLPGRCGGHHVLAAL